MTKEQHQLMARFTAVAQFCQRYARGLRMTSPGFDGQAEGLGRAIAVIHLEGRQGARGVVPVPVAQMNEARRALYEQLVVIVRLVRVMSQRTGAPLSVAMPYNWHGPSRLIQTARQVEGEGSRLRDAFLACGAPEDFLQRLRRVTERVEGLYVTRVMAREERVRRRLAVQTAFRAGQSAVVCLDVVVGAYCADGGGRRTVAWRQWHEIVPYVRAPRTKASQIAVRVADY